MLRRSVTSEDGAGGATRTAPEAGFGGAARTAPEVTPGAAGNGRPVLQIEDLRVEFRSLRGVVKALNGVHLTVHEGEIVGLVGESGCGKTVTGYSVLGLLPRPQAQVTSGRILFKGEDLLAKPAKEMRAMKGKVISMVFQDPLASLNPVFTVGEQISRVVRVHKDVKKKAALEATKTALQATGLPPTDALLKSYPHQLSGGMRQRVCMAMAISCGSAMLVADEPTTALDVTIQMQILKLLLRLREELGVAQILITHNVGVAAQTCDRIAVMYAGNVVEEGPTAEVLKRPRHPYTLALIECLPQGKTAVELQTIPGTVPDLIAPPAGCRFHERCAHVREICRDSLPTPVEVARAHWTACHWVQETMAGGLETGRDAGGAAESLVPAPGDEGA
ncbi:MAG: ABC transporter ATP-binding protein [Actinobacteria bacterium]|nr:ABC transporter ATP-binding protein [Actinomycetota bacterium]